MFDQGDWLPTGLTTVRNESGKAERLWSEAKWRRWSWAYIFRKTPHIGNRSIRRRGDDVSQREWRLYHGVIKKQLLHKGGKP